MMRLLYDDTMPPWLCLVIGQVNVASFRVLFSVHLLRLFYLGLSNLSLSLSPTRMIHAFVRPSVRDTDFPILCFFSCIIICVCTIFVSFFCSVLFSFFHLFLICFVDCFSFCSIVMFLYCWCCFCLSIRFRFRCCCCRVCRLGGCVCCYFCGILYFCCGRHFFR